MFIQQVAAGKHHRWPAKTACTIDLTCEVARFWPKVARPPYTVQTKTELTAI